MWCDFGDSAGLDLGTRFPSYRPQVALRACEYARERGLFVKTFFVPLQDKKTGAPITTLKEVAARIASVFGIVEQVCGCVCNLHMMFVVVRKEGDGYLASDLTMAIKFPYRDFSTPALLVEVCHGNARQFFFFPD